MFFKANLHTNVKAKNTKSAQKQMLEGFFTKGNDADKKKN